MVGDKQDPLSSTIAILAERWSKADVLLPAFPLLARGTPLAIADIAQSTGIPAERIEDAVRLGRCERNSAGRLIDLYGMTLSPTLHRVEIESRIVYSCCALWAHVIPKLIGRAARIESVDPVRRQLIRLTISLDGIEAAEPAAAMATLVHTTREAVAADVGAAFCTHVRHFVSQESAEQFVAEDPARQLVALSELQEAANLLYRAIWEASKSKARS
jgi:alkylmercury lyase